MPAVATCVPFGVELARETNVDLGARHSGFAVASECGCEALSYEARASCLRKACLRRRFSRDVEPCDAAIGAYHHDHADVAAIDLRALREVALAICAVPEGLALQLIGRCDVGVS